jgi:ATP-binding cassette subfamily F protein 3
MTVLQVADLSFGYGANTLFQGVTFSLALGERACLVAPNGAGKSTLLRLIGRELSPDSGTVTRSREAKIAYYRQSHEVGAEGTVRATFLSGFREILALREALRDAEHAAASGTDESLARLVAARSLPHSRAATRWSADRDDRPPRLQRRRHGAPAVEPLGGERGRLHLGAVLAQDADLLLLDEPTNHLDIDTIRWLEGHLGVAPCAMLVVSHDRAFLDAVCPRRASSGAALPHYPLPTRTTSTPARRPGARARARSSGRPTSSPRPRTSSARTSRAEDQAGAEPPQDARQDGTSSIDPEDVWALAEKRALSLRPAPRTGDIVLDAQGLGAERGGRTLFAGVDLLVRRGERLGIVGPNGSGKSTLLKLLAGIATPGGPEDDGAVRRGTNLREGYFDQHLGSLDPSASASRRSAACAAT